MQGLILGLAVLGHYLEQAVLALLEVLSHLELGFKLKVAKLEKINAWITWTKPTLKLNA